MAGASPHPAITLLIMSQEESLQSDRSRVRRIPDRGHYDRETVHAILDAHCICQVAFVHDGLPEIIPTLYGRDGEHIYLHGAARSRMLEALASGAQLCLSVTLLDALVLARSGFHSSANYRSVVLYGTAQEVTDPAEKEAALAVVSDHILPGRWEDVRRPSPGELKATAVLKMEIREGAAKIRAHGVKDDPEDLGLDVWAGLLPLRTVSSDPIADEKLRPDQPMPGYLEQPNHRWKP